MNIIKFKDLLRADDPLFNKYLKGKYAYWVQMRYVVPFDCINSAEYVKFENDIKHLIGWRERGLKRPVVPYWDLLDCKSNLEGWIDVEATESANNIMPFIRQNKFTTDEDITIDEIKKFRRWLAENLLEFDRNEGGTQKNSLFSEEFTSVLEYYAGGMFDKVTKALSRIPLDAGVDVLNVHKSGCSVCNSTNPYTPLVSTCDALSIYRKYNYQEMVKKFSNPDFWCDFSNTFLLEFKQYIDNIIACNLPLVPVEYQSVFTDCTCQGNSDQIFGIEALRRLSKSLSYITDDDMTGHKNFIGKAFSDWATSLYENMEWA